MKKKLWLLILLPILAATAVLTLLLLQKPPVEEDDSVLIYDLRTEDLNNPVGLDDPTPVFSWKMASPIMGQKQTAYQLVVSSGDTTVWDSGKVESSDSVSIPYGGTALTSSTAYTWTVNVWDKDGLQWRSDAATFEMGLLEADAFADTHWISYSEQNKSCTEYTVDFDFFIESRCQGMVIGLQNPDNYLMLQLNIQNGGATIRPHIRKNGAWADYPGKSGSTMEAIDVSGVLGGAGDALKNKTFHERIVVKGAAVQIWLGESENSLVLAGTYTHTQNVPLYEIGIRQASSEIAWYDNIKVADKDGNILYQNDFSVKPLTEFNSSNSWIRRDMLKVGGSGEVLCRQTESTGNLPAYRKAVQVKADLVSAKLYTSGLGVYESYINGQRVGRLLADGTVQYDELKPGATDVAAKKFYNTYDVTWMLTAGQENVLSAIVTSGWWNGAITNEFSGNENAYLAKLILTYADGTREIVNTDTSWKVAKAAPVQEGTGIYPGETYDARVALSWMQPGFDDSSWMAPSINTEFTGKLCAFVGQTTVVRQDLERIPQSMTVYQGTTGATSGQYGTISVVGTYQDGDAIRLSSSQSLIIDFGQNFAGWEYFEVEGPAGTTLTVEHGEWLNDSNGDTSRGNDGPEGSIYNANYRSAKATTTYILSGNGVEKFHPTFTFYGFQYVKIKADQAVTIHKVRGQVVTSVKEDTGTIETSNKDINQLISNSRWGMYSNYLSIPTDCPQRSERQGWTGDAQIFAQTGMYLGNNKSFLIKFMEDMVDSQRADGAYPQIAPMYHIYSKGGYGHAGWADAGIIIPYYLYMMYGDASVITDYWESMERYMAFMAANNGPLEGPGDHLTYDDSKVHDVVRVAYYAWDAQLMSQMAQAIGNADAAQKYAQVYESQKDRFQQQFVNADGTMRNTEQTAYLYALYLDLLPNEASVQAVTQQLANSIQRHGNKMQTGFLGTAIINPALTKAGRTDLAYTLLLQEDEPSWLYSVKQGATTIWERWNTYTVDKGFGDVSMNSFNHYAYGSITGWIFQHAAGIGYDPENPGFQSIVLAPHVDASLSHIQAAYDSAYGTISVNSLLEGSKWTYAVTIPANTTGTVKLPVAENAQISVNGKAADQLTLDADCATFVGYQDGCAVFQIAAGTFTFTVNG